VTTKAVVRRVRASADIAAAVSHYLTETDGDLVDRFIDEVESAIRTIAETPATGSPRFGDLLALPGLRSRRVAGFPYLVFYVDGDRQIEVWRVLHERRDIAATLLNLVP